MPGNLKIRADWRSVEQLYGQFTSLLNKGARIAPEVAGALATSLGRVLAFYEDNEGAFVTDLCNLWSQIDQLTGSESEKFHRLYFDARLDSHPEYKFPQDSGVRRRPRPFETAVETTRRLIDLNKLRNAFAELQTAAILGGSASYGRFYNVAGAAREFGSKSSDTDLLLVIPNYSHLPQVANSLKAVAGVSQKSLKDLLDRVDLFSKVQQDHPHCIFSHKLKFWEDESDPILVSSEIPSEYALSLHIFSLEEFDYLTLKDVPILEPDSNSHVFEREIHDYRDSRSDQAGYDNKSFSGIPLKGHDLQAVQVERGFITSVQVCLIKEDRFCPGLHQNLILPQFEMRWESNSVRLYLRMLTFRWKILERLREERTRRPFERQEISLSHVRYFVFSPHIQRRADRDSHV
jgi:hypothetical protein